MAALVRAFTSGREGTLPEGDEAALEALLSEVDRRARTENQGVSLAPEAFAAELGRLCPAGEPAADAIAKLRTSDVFFTAACLEGDPAAQRQLHERATGMAVSFLARYGHSRAFVEDLVQDMCQRLLVADDQGGAPKLRSYSGRGPFASFLRVALTRAAQNATRGRREAPIGDDESFVAATASPELDYLKRRFAGELATALREVLAVIDPGDRALLKQHYLRGKTLEEVAEGLGVSRATAARRLARIKGQIVEEVYAKLELSVPRATGSDDLLALVESHFDLSISRHLD